MMQQHDRLPLSVWLKFVLSLFLFLLVGSFSTQPLKAGGPVWTVCKTGACDFSSIEAALFSNSVQDGHTLNFLVNKETYNENITITKSLTFEGQTTTINALADERAVNITGSPTVVMQNMIIQNGNIEANGGGIRLGSGDLTLINVTFNNNSVTGDGASNGLGGSLYISSSSSSVTLTDVTIQTSTAVSGGGLYNNGTINATNLTFTDNDATSGGAFYNSGTATVEGQSAARRNDATSSGGGFYNATGATLTLISSELSNNTATNGAGIYNAGILQLTDTDLGSGNNATAAGGGLYNSNTGQATLSRSAAFQNDGATGAGVYNAGTLTANNSTLSRNEGANGGGLYNHSGTATLNNVTIHLTIGTSLFVNGGAVTVSNTIISSVSGQTACGGGGTFVSNGYNLANDQSCTFLTAVGDLPNTNPDLNGITASAEGAAYHTPKLTSPVINAGNPATPGSGGSACRASDQRGLARPQNMRCDIGAVEIFVYRLYTPLVIK